METSHGSAELLRYSGHKVANVLRENGSNSFQLGLNVPYGYTKTPNPFTGERIATDYEPGKWERIDNYNFGCSWTPAERPGMSVTFGSARSGKGAGLIIPNLTNYGGNLFVNDPKGENAWITAPRRRALGHKVAILDFFGEVDRAYGVKAGVSETTTKYNPLHALDPSSLDFAEDVAAIGEALAIDMSGSQNSEFFSGSGRDLIDGLVAAVVESAEAPGRATLREVRRLLNLDNETFAANMASFCEAFPNGLAAKKLRQFKDMKDKTNIGVKATAKQQTTFLDSEQLLRGMEPGPGEPTFDFKELSTGALDVFLVLPATHLVTHSRLVRMMVNQAMRAVLRQRAGVKGLPVAFMLDEAGTSIGHLDTVESAYGLTSGMGVLVWSFYQDINQLQRDYPKSWQTFIGNSAVITVTAARDLATAEFFSKYMGNKTIRTRTDGSSTSSTQGQHASFTSGSSSGTAPAARPLLTPEEIISLSDDKMLVLYPGRGMLSNFIQWKLRYYSDARFNGKYRPDPQYGTQYPQPAAPPDQPGPEGYPASYGPLKLLGNVLLGLAALLFLGVLMFHGSVLLFILVLGGGGYLKYKERHTLPGTLYIVRNGICYREGDPTGR